MATDEQDEVTAAESDTAAPAAQGMMSLVDHLQELRHRLIKIIIALVATSSVCYFYAVDLVSFITAPAGKLYYMHPAEAFFTYLKVSFFVGFLIALPVILYQVWAFILPALTGTEKKVSFFLVPASVLLFLAGLAFSYFLALPAGIRFMLGFATDSLQPLFSIGDYLSFVISFLLPFGFVFELPLFITVAAKLGLLTSDFLKKKRKVVFVLSFVFGAILSPTPDVFSQTLVAVPMLILYEISLLIVRYILRK
ncbi:MAG: twin-arginine translocase subunit TatC [Sporomusaceae bacterium]|nr:twin-arginine translocase subunit TatC [Sporomusaceae bacterium]